MSIAAQKKLMLSNGVEMPLIGLGTFDNVDESALETALITNGYRLVDTAANYDNEEVIGRVLARLLKGGKLRREDIFVTTKIWTTHLHPPRQEASLRESLQKLQLDYVDLVLAHMPAACKPDFCITPEGPFEDDDTTIEEIWKGFESLYDKKLARAIGVSNWNPDQIQRALKIARVPIHNNQIEVNLYWPQYELVNFCQKNNIAVTSFGTLASPGRYTFEEEKCCVFKRTPNPLEDTVVKRLAEKYGCAPGQILLRFCLERNIAVIPKSGNAVRQADNMAAGNLRLTPTEMVALENRPYRARAFMQDFLAGSKEDPFVLERLE